MYRFRITRNGRPCCAGDTLKLLCDECQKIATAQVSRGGVPPPPPLFGHSSTAHHTNHHAHQSPSLPASRYATRQDGVPPPPDLEALIRAKGAVK